MSYVTIVCRVFWRFHRSVQDVIDDGEGDVELFVGGMEMR